MTRTTPLPRFAPVSPIYVFNSSISFPVTYYKYIFKESGLSRGFRMLPRCDAIESRIRSAAFQELKDRIVPSRGYDGCRCCRVPRAASSTDRTSENANEKKTEREAVKAAGAFIENAIAKCFSLCLTPADFYAGWKRDESKSPRISPLASARVYADFFISGICAERDLKEAKNRENEYERSRINSR